MGMFDDIRCEYPLPGNPPKWAVDFQTKDLECMLMQYTITVDGRLREGTEGNYLEDFTGTVNFYTSNVVASGPGAYTRNGEDAEQVEYCAVFVRGKLIEIIEVSHTQEPAIKREPIQYTAITHSERKERDERENESLIGRTMCLWWGGGGDGYLVKVIAENAKEWLVQAADGTFEQVGRYQRDNCFFDSYEDGKRDKDERQKRRDAERKAYEEAIALKKGSSA